MSGGGQVGRYGKARTRVGMMDPDAQKAENAAAPRIPDLLRRIRHLFTPHRRALTVTISLVLVGAAISVAPPLLTQQAFDRGLFPRVAPPMCRCSSNWWRSWFCCGSHPQLSACGRPG